MTADRLFAKRSRSFVSGSRSTFYAALFLFLLAIYLLTYTPRINSSDGLAMFSTAESLVRRGALDIEQIRWMGLQQGTYGVDGLLYSRKGIGLPIGLLPLTWLGLVGPWFGPVGVSLLFNPLVTALTALLLAAYLQALGFQPRTGLIIALAFGLATLAWPYAKSLFSDPLSGLLLLAAAYTLLKMRQETPAPPEAEEQKALGGKPLPPAPRLPRALASLWSLRYPCLAGLCLGWNVATRYAEALFLPVFGLLLLYYLYRQETAPNQAAPLSPDPSPPRHISSSRTGRALRTMSSALRSGFSLLRRRRSTLTAFLTPILLIGLALIGFNISRYGEPFNTGYLPTETFGGNWGQGIVGQLISPGRGLLLYCPLLFLSLGGFVPFFRRHRPEAILAASIILIHLLLYGKWFMWHGGYAWGPRFMIPTLPFWAIFLAPISARLFAPPPPSQPAPALVPGRILFITLALLSLIPQLLTVTIHFSPFLDSLLDTGLPLFAPETFFDPPYSPLVSAWAFIQMDRLDLAWFWQGEFNGWLLGVLLLNIAVTGFYLNDRRPDIRRPSHSTAVDEPASPRPAPSSRRLLLHFLPYGSTAAAVLFLLSHVHSLPAEPLQQAVAALNEAVQPADAVITNDPAIAASFAELYTGRAPVLGLHHGASLPEAVRRRVEQTMAAHRQIWQLPNWLPPEENAVEQTLAATGFLARQENFAGQRLLLFTYPAGLTGRLAGSGVTFAETITLKKAAYPSPIAAGSALPVELQWQGLAPIGEDYHVFIHLVNAKGERAAQVDGQPARWTRPTSTWTTGEPIIDRHGLWVTKTTPPGDYQLSIGLYQPHDGRRLHLPNGADSVKFNVTVQPAR